MKSILLYIIIKIVYYTINVINIILHYTINSINCCNVITIIVCNYKYCHY